jgi:hypothetical protein
MSDTLTQAREAYQHWEEIALHPEAEATSAYIAALESENTKLRDALGMLIKHVKDARSPDVKVRMKDFREAMDNAEAALSPERKRK